MPRTSRLRSGSTASRSIIGLLLCALVVAGVLAYQAQDAARSHRQSAERALQEYASLAAWEFARQGEMRLRAIQMTAFFMPAVTIEGSPADSPLPSAEDFAASARKEAAWCRCLDSASTFFRIDMRDGTFSSSGEEPVAARSWLVDTLADPERPADPIPAEPGYGRAPFNRDSLGAYVFRGRRAEVSFGEVGEAPRTVWYFLAHDAQDRPLAAYGFEASSAAMLRPMLGPILEDTPLLPSSLTGDLPNDSLLAVAVYDRNGDQLFHTGDLPASSYAAVDTLAEPFQDLVVRTALRPAIAGDLLIGGLPRSRLPLLLALLGITAALVVVALVQLRRQQELADLRSDFVAGVSHELRTPLAQIRLFAELLGSGTLRNEEERTRSARIIDQEARRLSHLVENVLRFSRVERTDAESRVGRMERHELAPLIRDTIDAFEPLARPRNVEIRAELEDDVFARVDPDALRQMLLNLLDNAVKYGPAGQRIVVRLEGAGEHVRILVDDEGPGVPPEDRERVFEPYRRLPWAVESGTGGSGIGLSVVRELAEQHGGRVAVDHAPGGGARFVVELPAAGSAEPEPREVAETA